MTLSELLRDKRPIGVFPECNFGGLVVYESDNPEYDYITGFDYGNGFRNGRRTKVCYDEDGRAYIGRYERKYYLDEILRTE